MTVPNAQHWLSAELSGYGEFLVALIDLYRILHGLYSRYIIS